MREMMKYLILDGPGFIWPVMWPEGTLDHAEMARKLGASTDEDARVRVISAGRVAIRDGRARCYDQSVSLDLKSRPEKDSAIINRMFGLDPVTPTRK